MAGAVSERAGTMVESVLFVSESGTRAVAFLCPYAGGLSAVRTEKKKLFFFFLSESATRAVAIVQGGCLARFFELLFHKNLAVYRRTACQV